jgi:hypothetical protein
MAVPPQRPALTEAARDALRRREAAQAAALRENLHRRKQQRRSRDDAAAEPRAEGAGGTPGED